MALAAGRSFVLAAMCLAPQEARTYLVTPVTDFPTGNIVRYSQIRSLSRLLKRRQFRGINHVMELDT